MHLEAQLLRVSTDYLDNLTATFDILYNVQRKVLLAQSLFTPSIYRHSTYLRNIDGKH